MTMDLVLMKDYKQLLEIVNAVQIIVLDILLERVQDGELIKINIKKNEKYFCLFLQKSVILEDILEMSLDCHKIIN